jgi:hypothetical protein
MPHEIIPFGKHKGKPVEILAQDKEYAEWLVAQPWFKQRHLNIYTVVINNFRHPIDTPEHNTMQIKFLDQTYSLKLAYLLNPNIFHWCSNEINNELSKVLSNETKHIDIIKAQLNKENNTNLLRISEPVFEQGYDVYYSVSYGYGTYVDRKNTYGDEVQIFSFHRTNFMNIYLEIKPTVGDDFPAILRQIKASMPVTWEDASRNAVKCLLVGSYIGESATREQFVQFFQSQKYRVIFASDIENIDLPALDRELRLDIS